MEDGPFVRDIVERAAGSAKPPAEFNPSEPPVPPSGFPQPRKRWKPSLFKQQQAANTQAGANGARTGAASAGTRVGMPALGRDVSPAGFGPDERRAIDLENQQKMDSMSPEEIMQAQKELFTGLNPSLVQKLLRRAHIDDTGPSGFSGPQPAQAPSPPEIKIQDVSRPETPRREAGSGPKPASVSEPTDEAELSLHRSDEDAPASAPVSNKTAAPSVASAADPTASRTHFPTAPLSQLDPADPDFLSLLHDKYFPNLPADPSKLAWMAPVPTVNSPADRDSPYYPDQPSLSPSVLRFDFRGTLVPPRLARAIPVSKGLHHHGQAPEAAGYTIGELAILARSAVPGQRCIAFQTLGRLLYRLGKGEWGGPDDDLARGLWHNLHEGRVMDTLTEAASASDAGHRGSKAFATEAVWLFEKGGWKIRLKGR